MWDIILLGGLYICTAGISLILYFTGVWHGGLWWGIFWNIVTVVVIVMEIICKLVTGWTMTQQIKKWARQSTSNLWIARAVVVTFLVGGICLAIHLFPF